MNAIDLYLEIGGKRLFACALAWPDWSRVGRDEEAAVQALLESAPRYAAILHAASIDFSPPTTPDDFHIIERLPGNSTTDFGAPDVVPTVDREPMSETDLTRAQSLLATYWHTLDHVWEIEDRVMENDS